MLTDDARENVDENRRRLGETVGHPWPRFCYGRQVHGTTVRRATEPPSAARPYSEEDGQATALEDAAAVVFTADCLPVLLAASGAVAALHCGWRPLAGGIVDEGVRRTARGRRRGSGRRGARPGRPRLLLRGGRGGPRALRGLRRPSRPEPGPGDGGIRAIALPRHRGAGHGHLHDVRPARPAVLPSPRPRCHRSPVGGRVPRLITGLDAAQHPRQPRSDSSGHRRRRTRSGPGRDPRRRQVRRARGDRRARRGRAHAARRESRPGARGQGDRASRVPLALHRPAAVAQGQGDPPARRADPLRGVRVRFGATRAPRRPGHADPARGQRRRRAGQGGHRSVGAARATWRPPRSASTA